MFGLGPQEMMLLALLGLLFFGSNLPKLGRSLGQTIVAFRQGVNGIEDNIESSIKGTDAPAQPTRPPERLTPPAPKFEVSEPEPETSRHVE